MKTWQLGYRFPSRQGYKRFSTPYVDLHEFTDTQEAAYALTKQLQTDFPNAEWRLVECLKTCNCSST